MFAIIIRILFCRLALPQERLVGLYAHSSSLKFSTAAILLACVVCRRRAEYCRRRPPILGVQEWFNPTADAEVTGLLNILDLPCSAIADTILVPYDLYFGNNTSSENQP
jgi:hypothetical protein